MAKTLAELTQAIVDAEEAQEAWLRGRYPKGVRVEFFIMSGQKTASTGTVVGHAASRYGGSVRVMHDQAKPHSRYLYRDVSPDSILRATPAAPSGESEQ